jgi:hypothetical protein
MPKEGIKICVGAFSYTLPIIFFKFSLCVSNIATSIRFRSFTPDKSSTMAEAVNTFQRFIKCLRAS